MRCSYCIAGSQGEAEPWFGPERVTAELRDRLAEVPLEAEVFVGALVDAYPREEEALGVTRRVLQELSRQRRAFCINTKSTLVQRDVDILLRHQAHCDVYVSLCSLDQGVISRLEVNAPSVADRLRAVSALHANGVDISIDAAPWIPGASDIAALLAALPVGVGIQVAPLSIGHMGSKVELAGMRLTQETINTAYRHHRQLVGDHARVRWKDPEL
jgi:DNA repair photolyase